MPHMRLTIDSRFCNSNGNWKIIMLKVLAYVMHDFTARRCAVVVYLSDRPSHAGIVPKRLNVRSRNQRHTIAQGL